MSDDTAILRDILSTLREIRDSLRTGGGQVGAQSSASSDKGGKVAGDRELDSEWGNPLVRKDPKRWQGGSFVGCTFSECPPEYLDELAGLFDWMADKDEESGNKTPDKPGKPGRPTAPYKRSDASRARGWAKRIRDGWKPPAGQQEQDSTAYGGASAADDLPF